MEARELTLEASLENLPQVLAFTEECLEEAGCPMKGRMQTAVAAEEIFVNIAHYAYGSETGTATVRVSRTEDPPAVSITFADRGVPYNPLAKADPDLTVPAEERAIGGLGIFMTKKLMDGMAYEYRDGQNILTLTKKL